MKKAKVHFAHTKAVTEAIKLSLHCGYVACGQFMYMPGRRISGLPDESTTNKQIVTCGACKRTKVFKNDK